VRVADYIMDAAVAHGIRHVFSVPGGFSMYMGESAAHHPDIEVIYCGHEQAAAIAAQGYCYAAGRPAMVLVTAGPGLTNTITAFLDGVPMLILSGQMKTDDLGLTGFPRFAPLLPTVELVRPITCYAALVDRPGIARHYMTEALEMMERGPVVLDIPLDIQAAELAAD